MSCCGHIALHQPLYDGVSLELAPEEDFDATNEELLDEAYDSEASPALLERLWRFGRYLFISAASEEGYPVPLYGLWHGDHHLAWSQYVANENVEITYWHTMAGGLSYAIPPLLRYYTAKTEKLRECARQMFGTRGIWISAYTTPGASGPCVPVSVILNWISCAGWLCRHFWEYYLYTGDETLLREEILPFMREAALFYLDYAAEDGEYIRLYPAVSPENTPEGHAGVVAQNATMDFAILKELLTNLLEGMAVTGLYPEEAETFRALLGKIPPYMLNEDGAVKEWMHPDIKDNYHHRHLSHIYPVFPGNEVTAHSQPALFEAFKQAVRLRKLGSQSGPHGRGGAIRRLPGRHGQERGHEFPHDHPQRLAEHGHHPGMGGGGLRPAGCRLRYGQRPPGDGLLLPEGRSLHSARPARAAGSRLGSRPCVPRGHCGYGLDGGGRFRDGHREP